MFDLSKKALSTFPNQGMLYTTFHDDISDFDPKA